MQLLDYWIDVHLPFPNPLTGYVHNFLTGVAALLGIFFVLSRITDDRRLSLAGAIAWLLLPSTYATCLFISTRHYVEGLVFACVVFCLAASRRELRPLDWAILGLASVASMLSKETYIALVPAILIAFGLLRRSRSMVGLALGLGVAYALYRKATVGAGMKYAVPLLGPTDYLRYLTKLPFTFAESPTGYLVLLLLVGATIVFFRKGDMAARRETWIFAAFLVATMFVLYPVAYGTLINFKTPDTWLRVVFLLNTVLLVWVVTLAKRIAPAERSLAIVGALGFLLVPGLVRCIRWWDYNMAWERVEATFSLDHPDRLLVSGDQAYWYFDGGVRIWYKKPPLNVILTTKPEPEKDGEKFRRAGEVWTYQDGVVRPDPALTAQYRNRFGAPVTSRSSG